jgi:hypothetical protein
MLFNRGEEALAITLVLPADLGAHIILPQERIELPPGKRTELTPIIDVPRARFGDHDLRVTLEIRLTTDSHIDLPITLRRP